MWMNTCRDSKESGLELSVAIIDMEVQPDRCIRETRRKGLGGTASKLSGAETGQSPLAVWPIQWRDCRLLPPCK
jgi:hypothetical protein